VETVSRVVRSVVGAGRADARNGNGNGCVAEHGPFGYHARIPPSEGAMRTLTAGLLLSLLLSSLAVAGPADKLIKRGDRYYGNRDKSRTWCVKAIECYEKALAVDTKSVEASWKFGRASYWLGAHTDGDEDKLAIFKKGIDVCKRAVALDPKSAPSRFWLAVNYGMYGETKGIMNSLALVGPIKKELETVLELDETFEGGGAHRALGRMYFRLPGVAGGSNEKSLEHLKRAVEIDGTRLLNHLFLAETYIAVKDVKNARKHLKIVVDAPFEEGRRSENEEDKARAKELLKELEE
jgi:hypothetical protein